MNEANYKRKMIKRLKDRGYHVHSSTQRFIAGWPDLQVIIGGVTFYIELKVSDNTLTTMQRVTLETLAKAGAPALSMRGFPGGGEVISIFTFKEGRPLYGGNGEMFAIGNDHLIRSLHECYPVITKKWIADLTEKLFHP